MIKKLLLLSLVVSQLAVSCSSDDSTDPKTDPVTEEPPKQEPVKEQTLAEQIAALLKQPYSALTPAQQKVKAEAEANDMLVQLDKTKSSGAIEAIINLGNLLTVSPVDIFGGKNGNEIEELINVSDVYGIYTWNKSEKIWVKTASTTELKFVFPAKASETSNTATLSSKSVASTVKVKFTDTYGSYTYDPATEKYVLTATKYDQIFLPSSADAVLTINGNQAATFTQTASYTAGKQAPDAFAYKMTLSEGYTWEMSGKKGAENTAKAALTYNGKVLLDFTSASTANIDGLIDSSDELKQYRGKGNGLFKLMDNFVIVADMDLATTASEEIATEKALVFPAYPDYHNINSDYPAYFAARNKYYQQNSQATVTNFNKNIKLILVSKKDGTKIADVVQHSEKSYTSEWYLPVWITPKSDPGYWDVTSNSQIVLLQNYDEVDYLRFNDNTEVAVSAYFSTGFTDFQAKFKEFAKAFNK